jgi:hypothetical protein
VDGPSLVFHKMLHRFIESRKIKGMQSGMWLLSVDRRVTDTKPPRLGQMTLLLYFFPFFFSKPHLYYIVYLLTCVTVCRFMCENGGPRKEKKELININLQQQHDAISHSTPSNSQESRFSLYIVFYLYSASILVFSYFLLIGMLQSRDNSR